MRDKTRTVIAIGLAVLVGILALPFVFSDLGPDEGIAYRVGIVASIFFLGGIFVGGVAGRRWPISALCVWSPFGMGLVMLFSKLTGQGQAPYWSTIGAFLLAPLAVALLGGYAGSRLMGLIASR